MFIPFFMLIGVIFYFNLKNEPSLNLIIINFMISIFAFYIFKKFIIAYKQNHFLIIIFYLSIMYSFISSGILFAKIDTKLHERALIKNKILIKKAKGQVKNIIHFENQKKICFIIKFLKTDNKIIDDIMLSSSLIKICTYSQYAKIIHVGESVSLYKLTINPLPSPVFKLDYQFARNAYFQNIIGIGYAVNISKTFQTHELTFFDIINQIRYNFSKLLIQEFGSDIGSIIAAITVGDRSYLAEDLQDNMKKSSIFHLIAISGLHISIFGIFFVSFIKRLSIMLFDRHIKYYVIERSSLFISLIAILLYLMFSGVTLSAQRAIIMALIINIAIFRGHQVINRRVINYTIIAILIFQPHSILNPGLQMSIFAVFSLICFNSKKYTNEIKIYINKLTFFKTKTNSLKCSTWNILLNTKIYNKNRMFHVEHFRQAKRNDIKNENSKLFHMEQFKENNIDTSNNSLNENVPCGTFYIEKKNINFFDEMKNHDLYKNYNKRHIRSNEPNVPCGTFSMRDQIKITNCSKWNNLRKKKIVQKFKKCSTWNIIVKNKYKLQINNNQNIKYNLSTILKKRINSLNCSKWNNFLSTFRTQILQIVPHGTICIFEVAIQTAIPHLAIMPITLFYFQNTSTYTVIANLIAIPLATIIIGFTIFYLITTLFHVEQLTKISKFLLKTSIKLLIGISNFFGSLSYNYITTHQISFIAFLFMMLGIIWLGIWQKPWRFYGIILYFSGIILCFRNEISDILIYKYKNKINTIIKIDNQLYVGDKQDNYIVRKLLESNNQNKILIIQNVPHGTFLSEKNKIMNLINCSTWNNLLNININTNNKINIQMFHMEHLEKKNINSLNHFFNENVPCGTFSIRNKMTMGIQKCSIWNIFELLIKNINEYGPYNIYIKKNKLVILNNLDYIGNRPWNPKYQK